jgi:hypothetical protein
MAQHVLRWVPRVVAQLNGKLGALQRWGQRQAATAVQRVRDHLRQTASLVQRVIHQNAERFQGRHILNKVLSLHEPHEVAICKGKRAKPAEYGCKVSLTIDRQGFVVSPIPSTSRIIADAETLPDALAGWVEVLGQPPPELTADRAFHHPEAERPRLGTASIARLGIPRKGKTQHPETNTAWFQRLRRLRTHIDQSSVISKPTIGWPAAATKAFGATS